MKRKIIGIMIVVLLVFCLVNKGDLQKVYAEGFNGGSGTYLDPYQVATADQLNQVRNCLGSYFIQTADIDLSGYANWTPIGNYSYQFAGIYDGNGYKISNLTINSNLSTTGLFGMCSESSILTNIKLEQVNVTGTSNVGALVGISYGKSYECSVKNGTIQGSGYYPNRIGGLAGDIIGLVEDCYANVQVSGCYEVGGLIGCIMNSSTVKRCQSEGTVTGIDRSIGGLVGFVSLNTEFMDKPSSIIEESFSTAAVSGGRGTGGLVGQGSKLDIINCFSTGQVTGTANEVGGLIGLIADGIVENTYSIGQVSGVSETGGLVGVKYDSAIISSYYNSETSGQVDQVKGAPRTTIQMKQQATYGGWEFADVWKITEGVDYPGFQLEYILDASSPFGRGSGTSADPYQVVSSWELSKIINYPTSYFIQTEDIDLSGFNWTPIGNSEQQFNGYYDGNNYNITGLTCNRPTEDRVGLFGHVGLSSVLSNINLIDVNISGKTYVGGLAGYMGNKITNCHVSGTVSGTSYVGGIAGGCHRIDNSSSTANVSGGDHTGGLSGVSVYVQYSFTRGNVTGITNVGGLVGNIYDWVYNSYSAANVTGSTNVGGLVGVNYGDVDSSFSIGSITGTSGVGGCIGLNETGFSVGNIYYNREAITDPGFDHSDSNKGLAKSIYELKQQSTYSNWWDFSSYWKMAEGVSYLQLSWESLQDFAPPAAAVFSPADGSIAEYPLKSLTITFDETVQKGTGNITITSSSGKTQVIDITGGQVTVSNKTVTISSAENLLWGETYQVIVDQGTFIDTAGYQCNSSSWNFTLSDVVLEMNVPAGVKLGVPFTVTVTAKDGNGGTLEGYDGRIHFASSDGAAVLPQDYTFTAGDNGTKTFGLTLNSAGVQSITVNDNSELATLVGYWKLDEGSGTTTADSSGGGFSGTLIGSPVWEGEDSAPVSFSNPYALNFNGIGKYVATGSLPTTKTDNITLSAWVLWNGGTSTDQLIVYNGDIFKLNGGYGLYLQNGKILLSSIGSEFILCDTVLSEDSWHHVAAVRENGNWVIYLDGNEVKRQSTADPLVPTGYLTIGGHAPFPNNPSISEYFNGLVDDVRIYDKALTNNEISSIAASGNALACSGTAEVEIGAQVTGAETNSDGTTICISFDRAMGDPSGKQSQFMLQVNGASRPLTAASLHSGDNTKIDLTVSNAPVFSGETVSISFTPGNITAVDGTILAALTNYPVTNTVPASVNLALSANEGTVAASTALGGYVATYLNNGTRGFYWNDGTQSNYTDDWCEVNWSGEVQEINKVVLRLPIMDGLSEDQRTVGPVTLQYRDENGEYHDLETVNSWRAPVIDDGTQIKVFTAYPSLNAKAVRVKFTGGNSDGWVFLEEIEVYNVPSAIVSSKVNHYTVNNEGNSITAEETDINTGTTVGTFLGNLNKQSGSSWKVVASGTSISSAAEFNTTAGKADGDTLAVGDKLAILAGDGSTLKVYTITVEFLLDQGGLNYLSSNRAVTPNMIEIGDNLYVTWAENNGGSMQIRVKKFDGTTWSSADNNSILNSNSINSAYNPVLCEFNNSLYLAWYEDPGSNEIYQVYVRKYNSGNWDAEINLSCSKNKAFNIKLAADNNYLYAVWVEKDDEGKEQVRVKKTSDGSTWNDAGSGSLNYSAGRAASLPDAEIFNNNLFAAWSEKGLIRVKKYDGTSWSTADNDTSLNYDPSKVADLPVFINSGSDLYLIWGEKTDNSTGKYQVRGSKFNGSTWSSISDDAGLNDDPAKGAYMLSGTAYLGTIYTGWTESPEGSVIIKTYTDQGGWGAANGINYDQAQASSGISFTLFNGTLYATWNEKSGDIEQIRVKSIGHE